MKKSSSTLFFPVLSLKGALARGAVHVLFMVPRRCLKYSLYDNVLIMNETAWTELGVLASLKDVSNDIEI